MPLVPTDEAASLYTQYLRMPYRIAQRFVRCGVPREALMEAAHDIYVDVVCRHWARFDASKSSPTTWMWTQLYWRIKGWVWRHRIQQQHRKRVSIPRDATARTDSVVSLLARLSPEASEVVHMILDAPAEIADELRPKNVGNVRRVLYRYLSSHCGWSRDMIREVYSEIRAALC